MNKCSGYSGGFVHATLFYCPVRVGSKPEILGRCILTVSQTVSFGEEILSTTVAFLIMVLTIIIIIIRSNC